MREKERRLEGRDLLLVGFTLFSMFFGAGNLIFPPNIAAQAGSQTWPAMLGLALSAVGLPVLGGVAVARSGGLDALGSRVHPAFARVFTIVAYLAIGPCLAIPRTATTSFEMAVPPFVGADAPIGVYQLVYSLVFFAAALFIALRPEKLTDRLGKILCPILVALIVVTFVGCLVNPLEGYGPATGDYATHAVVKGFIEGYQTMDTIAALNFGLVIATTLGSFGMTEKRDRMRHTVLAGIFAGTILALVYAMLSYMGMCSSGVYAIQDNGAWTLRCIVYQLFGAPGAVLLAAIFTLACLTTCVGLINSISQYFSTLFGKLSYRQWVLVMTGFSFLVCNLGLNAILSISIPILNAIYPVAIVLILLGLTHSLWVKNRWVYSLVVAGTGIVSVIYALDAAQLSLGAVTELCRKLPLYDMGFCWVSVAAVMLAVSLLLGLVRRERA